MRIIVVVGAAILLTTSGTSHLWAEAPTAIHRTSDQETAVKTVVTEFGKQLRMVAVLAPKEMVTKAMGRGILSLCFSGSIGDLEKQP